MKKITLIIAGILAISRFSFAKICLPNIKINGVIHTTGDSGDTVFASLINGDTLRFEVGVTVYNCMFCTQSSSLSVLNYSSGINYNSSCFCGYITTVGCQTITLSTSDCAAVTGTYVISVSYINSVPTIEKETPFKIFPTISTGMFRIKSSTLSLLKNLTITDVAGNVVFRSDSPLQTIDLSSYSSGVYFYAITDDKEQLLKGKIMKID